MVALSVGEEYGMRNAEDSNPRRCQNIDGDCPVIPRTLQRARPCQCWLRLDHGLLTPVFRLLSSVLLPPGRSAIRDPQSAFLPHA